jgi:hypothetical protein
VAWNREKASSRAPFGSDFGQFEFRVERPSSLEFLVGGFIEILPPRHYTTDHYRVDLSGARTAVQPVDQTTWERAMVVPFFQKGAFAPGGARKDAALEFHGYRFDRTGEFWEEPDEDASRISPNAIWLVLQSRDLVRGEEFAKLYFDAFEVQTGKKIVTIEGSLTKPGDYLDDALSKTGWVTDRYFIVPLGKGIDRILVCDFGAPPARGPAR